MFSELFCDMLQSRMLRSSTKCCSFLVIVILTQSELLSRLMSSVLKHAALPWGFCFLWHLAIQNPLIGQGYWDKACCRWPGVESKYLTTEAYAFSTLICSSWTRLLHLSWEANCRTNLLTFHHHLNILVHSGVVQFIRNRSLQVSAL